jgi:hypothetical protein
VENGWKSGLAGSRDIGPRPFPSPEEKMAVPLAPPLMSKGNKKVDSKMQKTIPVETTPGNG